MFSNTNCRHIRCWGRREGPTCQAPPVCTAAVGGQRKLGEEKPALTLKVRCSVHGSGTGRGDVGRAAVTAAATRTRVRKETQVPAPGGGPQGEL